MTYSSVVPSWSRTAAHSASTSSSVAQRDGTGWPSPSECVNDERGREAEAAGLDATRAAARSSASSCSGVASLPTASAPITLRRSAQWPTRNPAFTPTLSVERVEVLAERSPVPRHALLERGERHALDLGHHAAEVVGVLGRRAARA